MFVVSRVLRNVPEPLRSLLIRHRELLKFLLVGGTCFVITAVVNYALKLTVLQEKPVTALTVATIVATVVSYILNREWSFRTRGGRERHHEAALFFLISFLGVGVNDVPLLISRYVLQLQTPTVSLLVQEVADFTSGMVLGTLLAMGFRLWAFRRFVFPEANVRPHPDDAAGPKSVPDASAADDVA
ncbi:MAG: GtrA family protein [Actinocatenispora sp.]